MTNANLLGQVQLLRHLIQDGPYNLQIALVWPWLGIEGRALSITSTPRFGAPLAQLPVPGGTITDNTRNPAQISPPLPATSFSVVDFQYRYQVNWSDVDNIEHPNDIYAEQDALALYSLIAEYFRILVVGNGSPAFPALATLTDQIVDILGAPPTLEDFDRTLLRVTTHDAQDVIVMGNLEALATFWSTCYERGVNAEMWMQHMLSAMGNGIERPAAFVKHARWYVNELIPTADDGAGNLVTNVYFMQLGTNPDYGTAKGVFGIIPKPRLNNMFIRRQHSGVPTGANFVAADDVFWTMPAGVAVGARRSLAVLQNMRVIPF